jgi:hypothetical protein
MMDAHKSFSNILEICKLESIGCWDTDPAWLFFANLFQQKFDLQLRMLVFPVFLSQ